MSMPKHREMVEFLCNNCNHREIRPKHCPYTGILHGTGFVYKCSKCNADLSYLGEVEEGFCHFRHVSECEKSLAMIIKLRQHGIVNHIKTKEE